MSRAAIIPVVVVVAIVVALVALSRRPADVPLATIEAPVTAGNGA